MLRGLASAALLASCGGDGSSGPAPIPTASRTWRMGFSPNPPRFNAQTVLQGIDLWSTRAEMVIIHEEMPWRDLLAGMTPEAILDRDKVALVRYLRNKNLALVFMLDPTDGLSRAEESPQLRAAGARLADSAVQSLYLAYASAVDRLLTPTYLGLAAETNLIRSAAPNALYQAVVRAANAADTALRVAGSAAKRFISVQAETAWGVLGSNGNFVSIDQDFQDFAFMQALGISSYPYFGYKSPEDIPTNYYSRLIGARSVPIMVTEGGWTSANVGTVVSSTDAQARYITRHADLLDSVRAIAYLQLQFADIDLTALPPPVPANLPLFTSIGLADSQFVPKPALARWDALFARKLGQT
jgi:hypothetical protein